MVTPGTETEVVACILDEVRGFDTDTEEWVYSVACLEKTHQDRDCPDEHEMFRRPRL